MSTSRNLVVFDVDGTLTQGRGVGTRCYFQAFADEFGIERPTKPLHHYRSSTDSGIAVEVLEGGLGRAPSLLELSRIEKRYLVLFEAALVREPDAYVAVAGASDICERLCASGWSVALGTGNWRSAAIRKLEHAGVGPIPSRGAFADDARRREDVLRSAIESAAGDAQPLAVSSVVYVGDQPWDVAAAAAVGCAFVGIGTKQRRVALLGAGASHVVDDYCDLERFIEVLREADSPSLE